MDTIAKARSANMLTAMPMDLGAFKGKGAGQGTFTGTCNNCGKSSHKKEDYQIVGPKDVEPPKVKGKVAEKVQQIGLKAKCPGGVLEAPMVKIVRKRASNTR